MEQPLKKYEPKKCCHGKREYRCVECGGGGICQHKRRREFVKNVEAQVYANTEIEHIVAKNAKEMEFVNTVN